MAESPALLAGIDHVQLAIPAGAEEACRAFWVGTLGLQEVPKPPVLAARGGCWFRAAGVEVHLGVESDFRPARKAHPGLRVHDLTALAERLLAHGHEVAWDDDLPGFARFYADDPVGNRLEFLQPRSTARDGVTPIEG